MFLCVTPLNITRFIKDLASCTLVCLIILVFEYSSFLDLLIMLSRRQIFVELHFPLLILLNIYSFACVYACVHSHVSVQVEVRGRLAAAGSFLPQWGSKDQTPAIRIRKYWHPLCHLAGLYLLFVFRAALF